MFFEMDQIDVGGWSLEKAAHLACSSCALDGGEGVEQGFVVTSAHRECRALMCVSDLAVLVPERTL